MGTTFGRYFSPFLTIIDDEFLVRCGPLSWKANLPLERRIFFLGKAGSTLWVRSLLNFTHHAGRLRNTPTAATTADACQQTVWPDATLWFALWRGSLFRRPVFHRAIFRGSLFHRSGLWRAAASPPVGVVLHRHHYGVAGRGALADHVDGVGYDAIDWRGRKGSGPGLGYDCGDRHYGRHSFAGDSGQSVAQVW